MRGREQVEAVKVWVSDVLLYNEDPDP